MHIRYFFDYEAMSDAAARLFREAVAGPGPAVACLATGHSPLGLYRRLAAAGTGFPALHILKLDEWLGLPMGHPASCETYLRQEVLNPLGIPDTRYTAFHSDPADPAAECVRMQGELARLGKIDICVLGLGKNGHLAMNEPAETLQPHCHRARLAEGTQQHGMLTRSGAQVTEGLTLGMADVMKADRVLLLVSGPGKRQAYRRLLKPEISPLLPASFLWLHPRVEVLVEGMD